MEDPSLDKMLLFKIRIYEPAVEKGSVDKLVFAGNFFGMDEICAFLEAHEENIVQKRYKVNINTQEVDL